MIKKTVITITCVCGVIYLLIPNWKCNITQYGFYQYVLALGIPFMFYIKNPTLKSVLVTFCSVLIILSKSLISVTCLGIILITMIQDDYKPFCVIGTILVILFIGYLHPKDALINNIKTRADIYVDTLNRVDDKLLLGHGYQSFSKIPDYQVGSKAVLHIKSRHKHLARAHSDVLQVLYEFGVFRVIIFIYVLILPLVWLPSKSPIRASYSVMVLQTFVDFPWHRMLTFFMCSLIVLIGWIKLLEGRFGVLEEDI